MPYLILLIAFPGAFAWYFTQRERSATTDASQRRLLRRAASLSAGIGIAILAAGVAAFVLTDYNWLVFALLWAFGLLHLDLLWRTIRRSRIRSG